MKRHFLLAGVATALALAPSAALANDIQYPGDPITFENHVSTTVDTASYQLDLTGMFGGVFIHGDIDPVVVDADFLAVARRLLPPEPWGAETWKDWSGRLKEATGRGGRSLYHPLRLALTGSEAGPELQALLPLIGRQRVERRLGGEGS